jgi:protein-tyrosine phosphatase
MLRVRTYLYPEIERGVLALGWLRADQARHGRSRRLVFVCSGNICRSPYAQAVARQRGVNAVSCGTQTHAGLPANEVAIAEAARRSIDLTSHRTTRWEDLEIEEDDLIVVMQLRHALSVLPRARERSCPVVMLSSLLPEFAPVFDPYGKESAAFQRAFGLIDRGIQSITEWPDLTALQANGRAQ